MTIRGIGTDIVATNRIRGLLRRHGARLYSRILAPSEQAALASVGDQAPFMARRFAAKEAAAKALGTGLARGVRWRDIEVRHDAHGRPCLRFHGESRRIAAERGIGHYHLSISDEHDYAVAFVILEAG